MDFFKAIQITFLILALTSSALSRPRHFDTENLETSPSDYRPKREYGHGVTGPVYTFVKTDKNANYKWGVRHHVGHQYAGRR